MSSQRELAAGPIVLVRRCAWCRSVWTPDGWVSDPQPGPVSAHTTHGICDACAEALRPAGVVR